jgi:hypothetical protein
MKKDSQRSHHVIHPLEVEMYENECCWPNNKIIKRIIRKMWKRSRSGTRRKM